MTKKFQSVYERLVTVVANSNHPIPAISFVVCILSTSIAYVVSSIVFNFTILLLLAFSVLSGFHLISYSVDYGWWLSTVAFPSLIIRILSGLFLGRFSETDC